MDALTKGVIELVCSAVTTKKAVLPDDFDWDAAADIAKKHQIAALMYYGAVNSGYKNDNPARQFLFMATYAQTSLSEYQLSEINKVCRAFDENSIDYMPLKGAILKRIYPKPEMRSMGDADILIRTSQYDEAARIVSELGYEFKYESDHEYVWNKNLFELELHKRVMTTYNKDFYKYFGDGWQLAKLKSDDSTLYEMTDEDFFVYMFVHFTKHYRVSGIGIKHLVDLWVFKNAKKELDEKYIVAELCKMKLGEFYKNILDTLGAWFGEDDFTDKAEFISDVIFGSGVYGTNEAVAASSIIKISKSTDASVEEARRNKWIHKIFLPYNGMKKKYPLLEKYPVLMPVMWFVRWGDILLFRRDRMKKSIETDRLSSGKRVDAYHQSLKYVGLDFNFKE